MSYSRSAPPRGRRRALGSPITQRTPVHRKPAQFAATRISFLIQTRVAMTSGP